MKRNVEIRRSAIENKERVADDIPADFVDELTTPWFPINRDTRIGWSE